jgi:hypothetical protein
MINDINEAIKTFIQALFNNFRTKRTFYNFQLFGQIGLDVMTNLSNA